MWLDLTLGTGVALAAAAWFGMSAYILVVQWRRDQTRRTLTHALSCLAPLADASPEARLAAADGLLARASRELVMRAASERELATHVFEPLAALLVQRWSSARLVADAGAHKSSRDKWRRTTALRILARLQHPDILDLLERAIADDDVDVATCGLALLGASTDPRAIDLLLAALESPRLSASRVAVYIDGTTQDVGAKLAARLGHAEPTVRQWAATLLQRYPEQADSSQLVVLTRDTDPRVRKAAIQTLGLLDREEAVTAGLQLLTDPVPYVRAHAARAIGELGRSDLAARISPLLGDGDWWVRLAARESLEMMGTEVWPVVARCLDHRDKFVRNGAAEVMQNIGVLDSLIVLEAASDNPNRAKVEMLQRIAAAGGVRFTESLVERAGPVVGPRIRRLLDAIGVEYVGAA